MSITYRFNKTDHLLEMHMLNVAKAESLGNMIQALQQYKEEHWKSVCSAHKEMMNLSQDTKEPLLRFLMDSYCGREYIGMVALRRIVFQNQGKPIIIKEPLSEIEGIVVGELGVKTYPDHSQLFIPSDNIDRKEQVIFPGLLTDAVLRYLTVSSMNPPSAMLAFCLDGADIRYKAPYGLPHELRASYDESTHRLSVEYNLFNDKPMFSLKIGNP